MGQPVTWLKKAALFVGLALLAVLGLLLFVVLAIAMRPLLMLALIVAALATVVLSCFSPGFRDWFEAVGERQISYSGMRLATDIAVHPSHSWARIAPEEVAVGADDFVQAVLGPVEAVDLPPVGSRVEQGDRLFSLRRGDRSVEVRAPISGTVITRNEALVDHPEMVNEGPFTGGWAVRLQADDVEEDEQRLLRGRQARGWFRQEIDRLIGTVLSGESVAPALPDGGTLVNDLYRQIDDSAWKRLTETFFGPAAPQG